MQYVGETGQQLKKRFRQHLGDIQKNQSSTRLVEHFNSNGHSAANVRIEILDRFDDNEVEPRKARETQRIAQLNTLFPNGLNMKPGKGGGVANRNFRAVTVSPPQTRARSRQTTKQQQRQSTSLVRQRTTTAANCCRCATLKSGSAQMMLVSAILIDTPHRKINEIHFIIYH
jgi:hypothetical protein